MPLRQAITLESHPHGAGLTLSPNTQPRRPRVHRRLEARRADRAAVGQPAPAPVLLRRRPGVRDAGRGRPTTPRRLFRLAGDRRALAPLRQSLRRRLRPPRQPPRRGLRAQPAGPHRPRIHRRLRHVMDLRGIESARRGGRLTSADRPRSRRLRHRLLFALVHRPARAGVARLGPGRAAAVARCCRGARAERIGRSAISWIYRSGLGDGRAARHDGGRFERPRPAARRARRADRRRQPSGDATTRWWSWRGCRAASAS